MTAVERIDDALGRIEVAARRPAPPPPPAPLPPQDSDELIDLRERHTAMRGRVEAAIAELDTLIRNG